MRISDWSSDVCSSDLEGDDAGAAEPEIVLERVARALDLAFVGASAKLVGELVALREPRRAERVALREQATRRIGHDLATIAVVAVVDELLGAAFGAEAERLIGDEIGSASGRERVCQ